MPMTKTGYGQMVEVRTKNVFWRLSFLRCGNDLFAHTLGPVQGPRPNDRRAPAPVLRRALAEMKRAGFLVT